MKKTMKLHVLMAGKYDVVKGARIDFHFDEQKLIYIASCEGRSFGIASEMVSGDKEDLLRMGPDFGGIVMKTDFKRLLMEVKIFGKKERYKCMKKN